MSESLRFTVIYEDAGDGWTLARIAEVPEVISQGQPRRKPALWSSRP